ncbi:hypothetical protein OUHCRE20_05510 [Enterobacter hormaechei subsp. steigerwaltii]|uniref:Uncharacterized protein n=1 Tax=Enterobacter cloacae TaxID=550 RepID=A0ABD0BUT2_ENTCL|nr:Uncharacterised protein [Klebsiella pneumoniae]BCZ53178.1 hypothetical protein SL264_25840 [Enterobacter cloacae]BCZ62805.1 hypothetical protein SL269_25890 [Klebsiella aerogenes]GFQ13081.1 hypothetical protein MH17539M_41850 [Enterobacter hormaechei]GFQ17372.1 hypothetical protein NIHE141904_36820 [Enterobacter hormaechei]
MALGSQVHYRIRLMGSKNTRHCLFITYIGMLKNIAFAIAYFTQGFQITGIGQFINVNNAIPSIANNMSDNRGTDKTGTASN